MTNYDSNNPTDFKVTSVELDLAPGYIPGQGDNPTEDELQEALRTELSDHLADPNVPIIIKSTD